MRISFVLLSVFCAQAGLFAGPNDPGQIVEADSYQIPADVQVLLEKKPGKSCLKNLPENDAADKESQLQEKKIGFSETVTCLADQNILVDNLFSKEEQERFYLKVFDREGQESFKELPLRKNEQMHEGMYYDVSQGVPAALKDYLSSEDADRKTIQGKEMELRALNWSQFFQDTEEEANIDPQTDAFETLLDSDDEDKEGYVKVKEGYFKKPGSALRKALEIGRAASMISRPKKTRPDMSTDFADWDEKAPLSEDQKKQEKEENLLHEQAKQLADRVQENTVSNEPVIGNARVGAFPAQATYKSILSEENSENS